MTYNSFVCVGLDEEKKLWLILTYKSEHERLPNDKHHERKVSEFYPIVLIDKKQSGGIGRGASDNGSLFFYNVERMLSGKILTQKGDCTGVWNPLCRPQRVFLKQGHAEFDLLECLFNPQAA